MRRAEILASGKGKIAGLLCLALLVVGVAAGAFPLGPAFWKNNDIDPYWDSVVLLVQPLSSDTMAIDRSKYSHLLIPAGTAALSTAINDPFGRGNKILNLTTDGDYYYIADHNAFALASSWTIEFWLYFPTLSSSDGYGIFSQKQDSNNYAGFGVDNRLFVDDGIFWFIQDAGSNTLYLQEGSDRTSPVGSWVHIAIVRDGGSDIHHTFVNGALTKSKGNTAVYPNFAGSVYLGSYRGSSSLNLKAYMYSARITNGVIRYTTSFTPPTAPFPLRGP